MSKDPYNLFNTPASQQPVQQPKANTSNTVNNLATWVLIVVSLFLGWRYAQQQGYFKQQDQQQEQKEDRKENDKQSFVVDGGTLLFVHERNPQTKEDTELAAAQDMFLREVPAYCNENKISGYRSVDDDLPSIQWVSTWALAKGVQPPYVAYIDKNGDPKKVMSWDAGKSVNTLVGLFK